MSTVLHIHTSSLLTSNRRRLTAQAAHQRQAACEESNSPLKAQQESSSPRHCRVARKLGNTKSRHDAFTTTTRTTLFNIMTSAQNTCPALVSSMGKYRRQWQIQFRNHFTDLRMPRPWSQLTEILSGLLHENLRIFTDLYVSLSPISCQARRACCPHK